MVPNYTLESKTFFNSNKHLYDFNHSEDCGRYSETFIDYLVNVLKDKNVGHLRKYGAQTQYNGHAIDALCYYDPSRNTYQSVDFIGGAEGPNASGTWTVQEVYYTSKDWYYPLEEVEPLPEPNTVPYVPYNEQGFQRLKNMLAHDYARRPQGADFDVSIWSGRYFHNCYMGPEGKPLGEQTALEKIKPELCGALGIPVACDGVKCNHPVGTIYLG